MTEPETGGGGPITVQHDGPVARVTLTRPAARNALNLAMCDALRAAFEALDADETIRIVILDAVGPVFCAGADLKERAGRDDAWVRARRLAAFSAYAAIENCSRPVIALVGGAAIGSGGEMALCCDFAMAADTATFSFPEPQWGTVGATQRLQRAIGKRRAKELLFTGRRMPASEALACGLVARVVPAAELARVGAEVASKIAKAPPLAMQLTKSAIDLGSQCDLATGIRIELAAIERNLADGGWRRGVEAFTQQVGSPSAGKP